MIIEQNLNVKETDNLVQAFYAWADADARSKKALEDNPAFFDDAHLALVDQVKLIADNFFKVKKAIYVTHRGGGNGRAPMTAVKVHQPTWIAGMQAAKQTEFYDKLDALGIKLVKMTPQGTTIEVR